MKNSKAKLLLLGIIAIVVIALPITIYLVGQRQNLRQNAQVAPSCTVPYKAVCSWDPVTSNSYTNSSGTLVTGTISYNYRVTDGNGVQITSGTTTSTSVQFTIDAGKQYKCYVIATNGVCSSAESTGDNTCDITVKPTSTPTPTPTIKGPTNTPTPTPTGVVKAPTGTPTPTPTPTGVIRPTNTPTPTPTTVVNQPTNTPTPTTAEATEEPTNTPIPTVFVEESVTNTPTATLAPTGPSSNILKIGAFGLILTIIGGILLLAL